jgi:hypothetical protein
MPELCPQQEARNIVLVAAWQGYESRFLEMLREAGCNLSEARVCMTGGAS